LFIHFTVFEDALPSWSPAPTATEKKREEMVERMQGLLRRQDVISPITTSAASAGISTTKPEIIAKVTTEKPRVNGKAQFQFPDNYVGN